MIDEFRAALNDAAGVFGIARSGLPQTAELLRRLADEHSLGADDPLLLTVTGSGEQGEPRYGFAAWQTGHLDEKLGASGPVARQIGYQWVTHVYHLWEDNFRERIAVARGLDYDNRRKPKTELVNPYMGDLRLIRHDILKHRGVASLDNTGRCEELRWFNVGDPILITEQHVYEFMAGFGLAYPTPAAGQGSPDPKYRFHGLYESPAQVEALVDHKYGNLLAARTRTVDGLPIDVPKLRDELQGRHLVLTGRNRQAAAVVVAVGGVAADDASFVIGLQADPESFEVVRTGAMQLTLRIGGQVPWSPTRRSVAVRWDRADLLVVKVRAPVNEFYDLEPFRARRDTDVILVSTHGDLYRAILVGTQYGPGEDLRDLLLYLRAGSALVHQVRTGGVKLRLPFILPDRL